VVDYVEAVYALLAIFGLILLGALGMAALVHWSGTPVLRAIAETLDGGEMAALTAVAGLAVGGSLYFSEVADFIPCELCWFQRIFMYSTLVVLVAAWIRNDRGVFWTTLVLSVVGLGFSLYHVQLELFPDQATICSAGVPCTFVWFRTFGFVTLPVLAAVAFGLLAAISAIGIANERRRVPESS